MIEETPFGGVKAQERQVIEPGVYDATLTSFSGIKQGINGEYVYWNFTPDEYPDVEVSMITSIGGGWNAKGMEIARRLTGKSDATDMKWGLELKKKRPLVNWGPELKGSKCQIVVDKLFDEELEVYKNRVRNVVAPGTLQEEDFDSIPF
jgi:hypothetical protein